MPTESRDILNYALAASVLILTFLVSWILVYIIRIFKTVEHVTTQISEALEKFTSLVDMARDKITQAAALLPMLVKGGEKIVETVQKYRDKNSAQAAKKTK